MFKNKWILIGLGVIAIMAYDMFVLKPYNQNLQKFSQEKNTSQVVTGTVPGQTASGAEVKSVAPIATNPVVPSNPEWVLKPDGEIKFLDLSTNGRAIGFFADGRIGKATFSDYTVREKKEKTPILMSELGFKWSSENPEVNQCLGSLKIMPQQNGETVLFSAATSKGNCFVTFQVSPQSSGLVAASLRLEGFKGASGVVSLSTLEDPNTGHTQDHHFLSVFLNDSTTHIRDKKLFEENKLEGKVSWLMWGDRYFSSTLLPSGKWNPNVFHRSKNLGDKTYVEFGFQYPLLFENDAVNYENQFYFSTRDTESLERIKPDLANAVDLGFFGSIANLLLLGLRGLNRIFNNFGVSIVVLTILVRLVFWPLNKKVFASGQRMKAVQPEVEKLKAKYGNDKSKAQELQLEIWNLYKKNKVNPMGSCLPLLLQMPIFFALYGALNHSLDLYQAPFFGWIQDLSSPDPFYILPVLWTLSLLAYMKINPTQPTQPTQPGTPDMKWIMIGMNIFIGYLSKDWPSGLTLYLFVSNLVGIFQQVMMLRTGKKLQPVQEGV